MHDKKSTLAVFFRPGICLAAIALMLAFAGAAAAEQGEPARKIVMFKKNFKNVNAQKGLLQALGVEEVPLELGLVNSMSVTLDEQQLNALVGNEDVLLIEDDVKIYTSGKPGKAKGGGKGAASLSSQVVPWGVERIDADDVWPLSKGSGVKVAVIDTGIDRKHPDLSVAGGINFVGRTPTKKAHPGKWGDDNGHGTHVAGIIGALDNAIGVVGVAPEVSLYAVKIMGPDGTGSVSDLIAGIEWAIANGMHLVNMSLGTGGKSMALFDACEEAYSAGIVLVAAAGNESSAVNYPAAFDSVIAVAAVNQDDNPTDVSNRGEEVDIAGPGVSIYSTYRDHGYNPLSGTSMATAHVTGALALKISDDLLSGGMDDFNYYIDLLCHTAEDIGDSGPDFRTGCGLVDALELATAL